MWKLVTAISAALLFLACGGGSEEAAKEASSPTAAATATAAVTTPGAGAGSLVSVHLCKGVLLTLGLDGITETPFESPLKESIRGGTVYWFPDGRRFAIAYVRENALYVTNSDGTGAKKLAEQPGVQIGDVHWSPDGSRIAFTRQADDFITTTIHVVNVDGTGEKKLAEGQFVVWATNEMVVWSPDGSAVLYLPRVRGPEPEQQLFSATVAGDQQPQKLIDIPTNSSSEFALSPDGTKLAYIGPVGGVVTGPARAVFITALDHGGEVAQVVPPGEIDSQPLAFSADGSQLAFVERGPQKTPRNDTRVLEVVNLDGSNKRRISGDIGNLVERLLWSADGTQILIEARHTILAAVDGSGEKKLELPHDVGCPSDFSVRPAPEG